MPPRCGAWIFPVGSLILILRRTQVRWEAAERRLANCLRRLHVAEVYGLEQGRERIAGGDEFVGNVAFVSGGYDAAHDAIPLDFLGVVEFVTAGNSACVVVAEPLAVLLDGADEITFHDLHVV